MGVLSQLGWPGLATTATQNQGQGQGRAGAREDQGPSDLKCEWASYTGDVLGHWRGGGNGANGMRDARAGADCCPYIPPFNRKFSMGAIPVKSDRCCVNKSYPQVFGESAISSFNTSYKTWVFPPIPQLWPKCNANPTLEVLRKLPNASSIYFQGDSLAFQMSNFFLCEVWAAGHEIGPTKRFGWGFENELVLRFDGAGTVPVTKRIQMRVHKFVWNIKAVKEASLVMLGLNNAHKKNTTQFAADTLNLFKTVASARPWQSKPTVIIEPWPTHHYGGSYAQTKAKGNARECKYGAKDSYDGRANINGTFLLDWLQETASAHNMTFMRGSARPLEALGEAHAGPNGTDCLHWCSWPLVTSVTTKALLFAMDKALINTNFNTTATTSGH